MILNRLFTLFYLFFLIFVSLSCIRKQEVPIPKPMGYFRLETPPHEYQTWDSVMPFSFQYSKNAKIDFQRKEDNIYWFNVSYPTLAASFKMTYAPVKNNLRDLLWNEEQQVMFHVDRMMTEDIQYSHITDADARVYGQLYELEGKKVATPFKFWLTDSARYFVKATLYFDFEPNNDSLAPIINYLKEDALFMIDSWKWK